MSLSFEVGREVFLETLEQLLPVAGQDGHHAQLQLNSRNRGLQLIATSPEQTKIVQLGEIQIRTQGSLMLPARKLMEWVKAAPDGLVELTQIENRAILAVGSASAIWSLFKGPGGNLPELAAVDFYEVDGPPLAAALGKVRYAASKDPYRPALRQLDVSRTHVTASDASRFAQVELESPLEFQIPLDSLDRFLFMLKGPVNIAFTPSHLLAQAGSALLIINQSSHNFPDVKTALLAPHLRNKDILEVDRARLQEAIRRARINADSETQAILLELTKQHIRVEAPDRFGNGTIEIISGASWNSSERRIVLQHRALSELLASSNDPIARFRVGPDGPRPSPLVMEGNDKVTGTIQAIRPDWLR